MIEKAGITPAYAGKRQEFRAHVALPVGSPPPMRGKGNCAAAFCITCGITPAYAGKSSIQFCTHFQHRDHPRLCGEKYQNRWT